VLATVQQGGRARLQGGGRGYVKDLGFAQALALYEYIASPQPPSVTVMGRSRSRVAGLVLLSCFVEHLLPKLHQRYVMKVDPAAALSRGQHTEDDT
jgi:hypothetical protein